MRKVFSILLLVSLTLGCRPVTVTAPVRPTDTPTLEPPEVRDLTADLIFYNGVLLTMEPEQPRAQAIAIRGDTILAVGRNEDMLAFAGPETQVIDLAGLTMMPGFIDGHTHYIQNSRQASGSLEEMMSNLVRFGLTSEAEMHADREFIEAMLAAEQNNEVIVRINLFAQYNYSYLVDGKTVIVPAWYLDNAPILDPSHKVRIPGVKIFMDGAGGVPGRGCAYRSFPFASTITDVWPEVWEFCGTPYGDLYLTEAQLTSALQIIQDRGYRASLHVMGDASAAITLDAIETVLAGTPNSISRHQIQHSSLLSPELVQRYVQLDIISTVPGCFNTCDADWYFSALGEDYYEWTVNRFSLADLGTHVYAGGDWIGGDVNKLNPFRRLYGLVTFEDRLSDGSVCETPEWIANHRIGVERALEMLTIEPAYAVSMENYIGSILPGKFADLIIVSDNPLTIDPGQLKDLQVWMTMVGGHVEYCKQGHEGLCPGWQPARPSPGEPVTIKLFIEQQRVPPGTPIQLTIGWAADTEAQVDDFLGAISLTGSLDGQSLTNLNDYWGETEPFESNYDGQEDYLATWLYSLGVLGRGTHTVEVQGTLDQPVTDGFLSNETGQPDEYSGEIWQYTVSIRVEE